MRRPPKYPTYRLLVTDVTVFGMERCVAGWDLDRHCMIRPEPRPESFWDASRVGPQGWFELDRMVELEAIGASTDYPHHTEDRVVVRASARPGRHVAAAECDRITAGSVSASLDELFEGHLRIDNGKAFVPSGTVCRSLGAIEIEAGSFAVAERVDGDERKPRARFEADGVPLDLSITSARARELHAARGIEALRERLAGAARLRLRLGLARAFPRTPDRCYLQVNGIRVVERRGA